MPPPLPPRYRLELRLGRDGDVEEWLAADTSLDRPVLIRFVGPETDGARRAAFLDGVRTASAVNHPHLAAVYEAAEVEGGAYSVSEWAGGTTMRDRLVADQPMPANEFLTNAAGLADALQALHGAGGLHGAIDPGAILFAGSHPAKLGSFGRDRRSHSVAGDVQDLAETLQTAVTGESIAGIGASEVVDGLPREVDAILNDARAGLIDAAELAERLRAAPSAEPQVRRPIWSWRWLVPALLLVTLAASAVALGLSLNARPQSPVLFPVTPRPTVPPPSQPVSTTTTPLPGTLLIASLKTHDPFGDGTEHDSEVRNLLDGDLSTTWSTERYQSKLSILKAGVGLVFEIEGTPSRLSMFAISDGTAYTVYWARSLPAEFGGWERVSGGNVSGGRVNVQLPEREPGTWLVWFTELPPEGESYLAKIAEVRFEP